MIDELTLSIFGVISIVMKAAPIGAFGAMAFTIGKYGPQTLGNLAGLIATFYPRRRLILVACSARSRASPASTS